MAKNVTKLTHVHVSKNTKTPAQRLKAEQNVAAAAERLERLQAVQNDAKEGRKLGMRGKTDLEVASQYRIHKAELEAAALSAEAAGEVAKILADAGGYKKRIVGFLADRITKEPAFVLQKINDFMSRPRNKDVKDYIDHVRELRNKPVQLPEAESTEAAA